MKITLAKTKQLKGEDGEIRTVKAIQLINLLPLPDGSIQIFASAGISAILYPPDSEGKNNIPAAVKQGFQRLVADLNDLLDAGLPDAYDAEPILKAYPEPVAVPELAPVPAPEIAPVVTK